MKFSRNQFVKLGAICALLSTLAVNVPDPWIHQSVQAATTVIPGPLARFSAAAANPIGYPDTISGLAFIWTADSITNLHDGDSVTNWVDLKAGNIATASGTACPVWKTNQAGSKPALVFDGTTDTMSVSNTMTLSITSGFTVISCWAYNGGVGTRYLLSRTGAGAGGIRIDVSAAQRFIYDGTAFPVSSPPGGTTTNFLVGGFRYSSANKAQFRQNVTPIGNPATALTTDIGLNVIGSYQGSMQFFLGSLESCLVYSRELSDAECDGIYSNWFKVRVSTLP